MTAARIVECKFPGCHEPVTRTGRRGRPAELCANPKHTSSALYEINRAADAKAARVAAERQDAIMRPVSARADALVGLVRRMEELFGELPALVADVRDVLEVIADPLSVTEEIAAVRRECDKRVADADLARADAERQAEQAYAERDAAMAARELADAAADEALEARDEAIDELDQVRRETREKVIEVQGLFNSARKEQAIAESDRDAAVRIAEARLAEVGTARTDLIDERREGQRRIDEAHAAHAQEMAAVRAAADKAIMEMRAQNGLDIAAVRDEAATIRAELREDLEAAHAELNALRRTGEFAPALVPQKRFGTK
ncbi:hypothetical protein [Nocardia sp. NPDC057030]|uniref:hypothetical protein n=1 Tax=unclassified Nocardia TaxID=2637762 RepID=UPI00363DB7D6